MERLTVRVDKKTMEEIDEILKHTSDLNRSDIVRKAVEDYIASKNKKKE